MARAAKNPDEVTVWKCASCQAVTDEEPSPLWECSAEDCGATFVSDDRACEQCNRPFSRKLEPHGCVDCQTEPMESFVFRSTREAVDEMMVWINDR